MANLYSKASFILTANAYSSSKLFSIKPTDGTGDLTFTRASSGSRINSNGVLELVGNNIPRLTYSGSSCPQFLFEPQRTNLIIYSEDFAENSVWFRNLSNTSASNESIVGPYGNTISASKITFGGLNDGQIYQGFTTVSQSVYQYSVWVKGINGQTLNVGLNQSASPFARSYNTVSFNGQWQKITGSFTAVDTSTQFWLRNTFPTQTNATLFYAWGAQVEVGNYPTSYIPTTTGAVTRAADVSGGNGFVNGLPLSSSIGQSEGTIYYEFTPAQTMVGFNGRILAALAPNTNAVSGSVSFILNGNDQFQFAIYSASSATLINSVITSFPSPVTASRSYKIAFAYSSSNSKAYINGSQVLSSAATWPLNGITGSQGNMNNIWLSNNSYFSPDNGNLCKTLAIYKTRLTDSELIALTS